MKGIDVRKADHIEICLNETIEPDYDYWSDVRFVHEALPEVDYDDLDTTATVLGKELSFPFMVTAITGGFRGAESINANIAEACANLGIGMGTGSERAGIDGVDERSYSVIKDYDVPLVIGNIGAPQLIPQKRKRAYDMTDVTRAVELVDADYIALHLNFLQEVVQPEGDTNAKGCLDAIRSIAAQFPVVIKETGAGISRDTIRRLEGYGVKGIDLAGMGGTSFSAVELYRAREERNAIRARIGETFFDWGIPTTVALETADTGLPLIASGGVRTGLDVARAIAMGASCVGAANLVLKEAMVSAKAVEDKLTIIREELKAAMLLTGSSNIKELAGKRYVLLGRTEKWIRGMNRWM